MRFRTTLISTTSIVLTGLLVSGPTLADANGPITFGDVMATFQASPVFLVADDDSAIATGTRRGRIRPRPVFSTFCEGDWLVAMSLNFAFLREDLQLETEFFRFEIILDGIPQETMTTAIKKIPPPSPFPFGELWYQNRGVLIAPGSLLVGMHHFVDFVTTEIATGNVVGSVTHIVEILPASDPACVNGG